MKYILLIHLRIRVERLRMRPIDFYILYIDAYKTRLCEPCALVVSVSQTAYKDREMVVSLVAQIRILRLQTSVLFGIGSHLKVVLAHEIILDLEILEFCFATEDFRRVTESKGKPKWLIFHPLRTQSSSMTSKTACLISRHLPPKIRQSPDCRMTAWSGSSS